ncbi:ATP-dependent Lon protease [Singulisphaera sp. GP187]|uniref:endopeptidase La n=1 Tax=Singulisphaera sp. GP187 TaxID=1882752 RepID=UPI000928B546|nr:endopeptidase La [Singulisphaera sp. GP187]SIO59296.1 ATP-dependent Lon protease [Singulisphaera sp. GP187]
MAPDPESVAEDVAATGRALVLPERPEGAPVLPSRLPLLPLRSDVVFPQTVVPLVVNRPGGIKLIDEVLGGDKMIGLVTQRHPDTEEPGMDDLYPTICVGTVLKMLKFPDGSTRIVCQGLYRAKLTKVEQLEPYLIGQIEPYDDVVAEGVELDALVHHVNRLFQRMVDQSQQVPEELQVAAMNTREPGRLADLLGSSLPFSIEEKQKLLSEIDVRARLEKLGQFLSRQLAVLELSSKIQEQVGSEITKAQRDHFLRQQIKAIQEELGEGEGDNPELDELWKRLKAANPPDDVLTEAEREIERLAGMHPSSAEYSIVRTYLDWMAMLPWSKSSRDRLDLRRAKKVLDTDHYDLEKVKERILEYLAVRKLKKDMKGPILCLAGPPGTGKTSLGKSIAKALGREFVRISLGGVHDEAEIRGHRRTYVAAMPGRILQGIRKGGTNNPVFMLDEVDKLGSDFRGDPSAALLEVLDPEQNASFRDHYLDVDFDLSKVMFIATANMLESIPAPLLDRMEVLQLPGYSEEEKTLIAQKYIIPKQLEAHGLTAGDVVFSDEAVGKIIADYTREAGLRNLEREIASICRKVARKRADGKRGLTKVAPAQVPEALGPPRYFREVADRTGTPGVATGLAWTPTGGEILFIEATAMPGKGGLTLTGLLGESMRESAQAAMSYMRSHAKLLEIEASWFTKNDVHIHVPAGAVPKDGPSAGVAISAALMSLVRKKAIHQNLAMTGEVTLTGRVLPVGGVREKILAARRAGILAVLIPRHNEKDLIELPAEVKADMTFHSVDTLDDVVPKLFPSERGSKKTTSSPGKSASTSRTIATPHDRKAGAVDKPTRRPRSA